MNIDNLNQMIEYIDLNLTEKIDYNQLAKIVGLSTQQFQRIFNYLTDMSVSEYIRKRRLSMAYEDLKNTNLRVIDIAYKYQYESDIAFIRAFKNMFGVTPTECRTSNTINIQYPKFRFDNKSYDHYEYEVVELQEEKIFAWEVADKNYEDFLYKIRELYRKMGDKEEEMLNNGLIGVSDCDENYFRYICGCSQKYFEDQKEYIVKGGRYLLFRNIKSEQKEMLSAIRNVYSQFKDSSQYYIDIDYLVEKKKKKKCDLYFLLIDN